MDQHFTNADADQAVRDAFARTLKYQEGRNHSRVLMAGWLDTPLGIMLAAGDDDHLYMLSYIEQSSLERKAAVMQRKLGARLEMGDAASIRSAARETAEYFAGKRREFETPLMMTGTGFQQSVWEELLRLPFGATASYADIAERIGKPAAFRAIAQANSQNPLTLVIPCHRVVNNDGSLGGGSGGSSGGAERKRWLLDFEQEAVIREDTRGRDGDS